MKKTKVMLNEMDEALEHVVLEMTEERKSRLAGAAKRLCSALMAETNGPVEGLVVLHLLMNTLTEQFSMDYRGTVLVGDRDVPESICYECGSKNNRAANASGEAPDPGDATICAHCGAVSVFDDELRMVKPDDERLKSILAEPHIAAIIASVKASAAQRTQS